jgi:serine/threonine protein kinase
MVALSQGGLDGPSHALALPRAFGSYVLFDRIGRGGMAEIFLASTHNELGGGRRIVIKEVLPELSDDTAFAQMLVREAKLAAKLSHRNIVQVFDLGRESGRLYIAMEYIEGYDLNMLLRQLSKRRLPLPLDFALLIVREMLQALDYAHRAEDEHGTPLGIVHRDVSPSNVLISFEGEVNLCDFGIARAMDMDVRRRAGETPVNDRDESRIRRVRAAGKAAYMAPEHARGGDIDSRADLFAAGIVLWELCAGRRLYRGSDAEMLEMACAGDVPRLPERGLPEQQRLQAILDRALSVDPASRFQSAAQMLEALDHYALQTGLMASQLRFGAFLTDYFAEEIVALRRARERAAQAPPVAADPVAQPHAEPHADKPESAASHSRPRAPNSEIRAIAASSEPEESSSRAIWIALTLVAALAAAAWLLS